MTRRPMVLLGVLATRLKDRRLEWDSAALRFTNDEEANILGSLLAKQLGARKVISLVAERRGVA